ncbi:MAG: DNA mismatch repair endonuclease MutL [Kiritimatiellae bacterium]|nr:DNA mismatch repair endonuclease MutL [Kiritimatiellia bacterium]
MIHFPRMAQAPHIRLLSDAVANKIAAGEVVDRPASVVKELLENAMDAGAERVDIEIAAGGRKAIIVSDDGCGMGRDDALLSIERHATSKIRDVDDIERVSTLGFRGEALAAVAAVSRFTLTTRPADAIAGTEIVVSGGKILEVNETGCPPGTTLAVRNLFFNVPARRKFLRSEQTELSHVRQAFITYALAGPAIGLRLVVDGAEAWRLPARSTLEERLRALFDADFVKALRPVSFERAGVTVSGFVGTPHVSRADRTGQYVFVNRRPASAPVLGHALREAYQALLPGGRHAALFLFIEMDPAQVDVNVHPTKREVRFRRPGDVRDAVIEAVRGALAGTPLSQAAAARDLGVPAGPQAPILNIPDIPATRTFQYPRLPLAPSDPSQLIGPPVEPAPAAAQTPGDRPWTWCRVLGQVGGLYVVMETEEGVVLMDPHAAHERVLFERFMKETVAGRVRGQGLLAPETVDLPPGDALCVRENLGLLKDMGFGISEFGGDSFIVDALPTCLGDVAAASVLADVAHSLDQGGRRGGTENWAQESIARAACKAAVKARTRLTLSEIEQLVVDLAGAAMPYTCPHGRPTLIFMGFDELHRKFGRE